jgi:hypothetical protein
LPCTGPSARAEGATWSFLWLWLGCSGADDLARGELDGELLFFDRLFFGLVGSLAENFVSVSPEVREFVFEWLNEDFTFLFEQTDKGSGTKILVRIKPVRGERGEGRAELGEVGHFDGFHCGMVLEEPLDHTLVFASGKGAGGVQHVSTRGDSADRVTEDATLATDVLVDLVGEEAFVSVFAFCHQRLLVLLQDYNKTHYLHSL